MGSLSQDLEQSSLRMISLKIFVFCVSFCLYFNSCSAENNYTTLCNSTEGEWGDWMPDQGFYQVRSRTSTQRRTDPDADVGGWKMRRFQHSPLLFAYWANYLKDLLC